MGYVIEVFQSRFPNVITDPNLSGFFPKSHGWSRFETQGEYMEIDEDAYITIRSKEIVVLGKSGVVVHIVGDGRNGHHDDVQGYRNFQGTAYAGCRKEWFEDEADAFSADQGIPSGILRNALAVKDLFCEQLVRDMMSALLSSSRKRKDYDSYFDSVEGPIAWLEKYDLGNPGLERERLLAAHGRRMQEEILLPKSAMAEFGGSTTDFLASKAVETTLGALPPSI